MNKLLLLLSMIFIAMPSLHAQPWYKEHHRKQSIDEFAASITLHAQTRQAQQEAAQKNIIRTQAA